MDFAKLILDSRKYLYEFDYDHYPENFEQFGKDVQSFMETVETANPEQISEAIDKELQELPKKEQKKASEEAKRVLALFFTPTALMIGGSAEEFATALNTTWNNNHRKNTYSMGTYDTILSGFDSSILGITLRKTNKKYG